MKIFMVITAIMLLVFLYSISAFPMKVLQNYKMIQF